MKHILNKTIGQVLAILLSLSATNALAVASDGVREHTIEEKIIQEFEAEFFNEAYRMIPEHILQISENFDSEDLSPVFRQFVKEVKFYYGYQGLRLLNDVLIPALEEE